MLVYDASVVGRTPQKAKTYTVVQVLPWFNPDQGRAKKYRLWWKVAKQSFLCAQHMKHPFRDSPQRQAVVERLHGNLSHPGPTLHHCNGSTNGRMTPSFFLQDRQRFCDRPQVVLWLSLKVHSFCLKKQKPYCPWCTFRDSNPGPTD